MNQIPLTKRERQVARLLTRGLMHKEICGLLNIVHQTVDKHQGNIYRKIPVKSRMELVRWMLNNKHITIEEFTAPDLPKDWASL